MCAACVAAAMLALTCSDSPTRPAPIPAPSLTCPANLTLTGVVGGSQDVSYTPPAVRGGAAPVTTTCTPASGSSFPTGTTTVTCTATDAQGRQATCGFTVTLDSLRLGVRRFLAFGDSVTAGEDGRRLHIRRGFIDPIRAYPAVLAGMLEADFPGQGTTVINEGLGGARVEDDVDRLPVVLQAHQPGALLLLHGYNDLLRDELDAVEDVVESLQDCIEIARGRGIQHVFVSTLTPSRPSTGPFNRTIEPLVIEQVNARIKDMVAANGAYLVDAYAAFGGREQELVEVDGLHLTVLGNQVLAEAFYTAIRAALGSSSSADIFWHRSN